MLPSPVPFSFSALLPALTRYTRCCRSPGGRLTTFCSGTAALRARRCRAAVAAANAAPGIVLPHQAWLFGAPDRTAAATTFQALPGPTLWGLRSQAW